MSDPGTGADLPVRWVDDDRALAEVVRILGDEPAYGLDTEFMAERSYWPKLCLVQLSWRTGVALVDPFVCDVRALADVLRNPATMITHAGASDLPILERAVGARPAGLFDVQLAAGFVGLGTPSLGSLVSVLLGIRLDKGEQLTDWSTRPLRAAARRYAADDVAHLLALAAALRDRLEALGREAWATAECEQLRTTPPKVADPDTAWWRIKGASAMKGEEARVAQTVAAWRDRRARQLDVPPRFVLSELALAAVVRRPPRDLDDIGRLRGVSGLPAPVARELLAAVEEGRALDPEQVRRPPRHEDQPELDAAVALLSAWVTELATAERIDKKLLATRDDVKDLVYGRPSRLDLGWRAERCGHELRKVLEGRAVVRLVDGGRRLRLEED